MGHSVCYLANANLVFALEQPQLCSFDITQKHWPSKTKALLFMLLLVTVEARA